MTNGTPTIPDVLATRVLDLYRLAGTSLDLPDSLGSVLARVITPCVDRGIIENPRQALKFITEIVDIARHCSGRIDAFLREVRSRVLGQA